MNDHILFYGIAVGVIGFFACLIISAISEEEEERKWLLRSGYGVIVVLVTICVSALFAVVQTLAAAVM